MPTNEMIINFKGSRELRDAIKDAAYHSERINSSEFMRKVLMNNKQVKKFLSKEKPKPVIKECAV